MAVAVAMPVIMTVSVVMLVVMTLALLRFRGKIVMLCMRRGRIEHVAELGPDIHLLRRIVTRIAPALTLEMESRRRQQLLQFGRTAFRAGL